MYSVDAKIGVLRMINIMNADSKVGEVRIRLNSYN